MKTALQLILRVLGCAPDRSLRFFLVTDAASGNQQNRNGRIMIGWIAGCSSAIEWAKPQHSHSLFYVTLNLVNPRL
ncbi:hypothetical protein AMR42_10765 [Limnothrix sp. PR1529]|nr:hypothetical protein BCR12_12520 [Limnothrix sp. P13C2]PIB10103.1 hypothetical protein AMR42_10765 [Limnothrix sp. PR1529]